MLLYQVIKVMICAAVLINKAPNVNSEDTKAAVIIIIIKISNASPSGKNRTFTKLQSNPTSTCATEKRENRR